MFRCLGWKGPKHEETGWQASETTTEAKFSSDLDEATGGALARQSLSFVDFLPKVSQNRPLQDSEPFKLAESIVSAGCETTAAAIPAINPLPRLIRVT